MKAHSPGHERSGGPGGRRSCSFDHVINHVERLCVMAQGRSMQRMGEGAVTGPL